MGRRPPTVETIVVRRELTHRCTFAAVIAHADDADMLRKCIVHHRNVGVERVFVSLNRDDPESASVARDLEMDGTVRSAPVKAFAPDPFQYFTAAVQAVMQWVAPDWILFIDSDEFWMPSSGRLQGTADLYSSDLFSVPRYNAVPVRGRGGIRDIDPSDFATTPIATSRRLLGQTTLDQNPESPWIQGDDGGKIMARPELVVQVGRGAHDVVAVVEDLPRQRPADLIVLHLPFTTEARFLRKIDAVRARLALYGDRFEGAEAWHWRRWVAIADAGGLHEEFERQVYEEADVPRLLATGVLTTPAAVLAGTPVPCG
jgi:hypothetical protein